VHADNLAWDPDYMGSSMMVPVVYVTWFMAVVFTCLLGKLHHPARTWLIMSWKALLLPFFKSLLLLLLLVITIIIFITAVVIYTILCR